MKVVLYDLDTGGIIKYSRYLTKAMEDMGFDIKLVNKLNNYDFDVIHIQFEHTIFHPFGLKLIPLLIKLKLMKKKVLVTTHTVLLREEIYAKNKLFTLIKKILLPIDEMLMGSLYDRIIVHTDYSKKVLIKDYYISKGKIGVIPYGVY